VTQTGQACGSSLHTPMQLLQGTRSLIVMGADDTQKQLLPPRVLTGVSPGARWLPNVATLPK
jgi:hypothetical protein